ncbi:MAG TPA: hypothetical protein ENJ79_00600 [Gammaproteobacteria bacterium]|nr:hypothetical protein [Gammaproteobacteria bacterium]
MIEAVEVHVYSSDGEKWDKVDANRTTKFKLGFDAECKWKGKGHKAYEGYFYVNGFSLAGNVYPEGKGVGIETARWVKSDLRWTGENTTFKPAQVCNSELDKRLATQAGKSKYDWLAKGFSVNYADAVRASYVLFCYGTGLGKSDIADNPARVNVRVVCEPSAKAKSKIPKPAPRKTQLVPAVKTLKLKLNPTRFTGQCPAKVKVDTGVTLAYPAEIKYQYVGDKGHKSPVFTLKNKGKAGSWNLAPWNRTIKAPNTPGKLSIGPAKGDYLHKGWMKIKVLSPKPMTSKAVNFTFRCQHTPPQGPGKLQTPKPAPRPGQPALRSGAGKAQPARTHRPREIVVVGSKVKKDDNNQAVKPISGGPAAD